MPNEDIEVRITRTGEVFVTVRGATEERLRDYHAFLEEAVGPVHRQVPLNEPDWDRPVEQISEEEKRRRGEQELQY
jgi:hypothetical protein